MSCYCTLMAGISSLAHLIIYNPPPPPPTLPSAELYNVITRGTRSFYLCWFCSWGEAIVIIRPLCVLMTVCRGWLTLSMMFSSLFRFFLCNCHQGPASFQPQSRLIRSSRLEESLWDVLHPSDLNFDRK